MKRLILLSLVLGFVGVAVFGFVSFDMGPNHSGGCIASVIDGVACPANAGGIVAHHLSVWQSFMTTWVAPIPGWFLLVAFLFLISISFFLFRRYVRYPKPMFVLRRLRDLARNSLHSQRKIISWLSLFELSPAF